MPSWGGGVGGEDDATCFWQQVRRPGTVKQSLITMETCLIRLALQVVAIEVINRYKARDPPSIETFLKTCALAQFERLQKKKSAQSNVQFH